MTSSGVGLAFPDKSTLEMDIALAMSQDGQGRRSIVLLDRERTPYQSTFPCEILTLEVDGDVRRLFCKYQGGRRESLSGHRRDVSYELDVYRNVLAPLGVSSPQLFCGKSDSIGANSWFLIDYVEPAVQMATAIVEPVAVVQSATWIAEFHLRSSSVMKTAAFLISYDSDYLLHWSNTVLSRERQFIKSNRWILDLLQTYQKNIGLLLSGTCVVHGEFYPDNILFSEGVVVPVDWQSAAIGAGEIDLAVLTHGDWGSDVVRECERAYCAARWPNGAPGDFDIRLALARVYWLTRVLAEQPGWIASDEYFSELRAAAKALHVVE
jgi:hypothetical protein